ncbi:unnamed protein product [Lymnaea stagnalis]|uniref:Ubiquitin-like domain-containing protein n=1 Tax=Lymnaea stagnalis TaxID=6523 RepID=A0AAV2IFM6_LYMST
MATNGSEIFVKLPSGRNARYEVLPSQKLQELCNSIAAEEKVKSSQVTLKFQGKLLDNDKTVAEYGIRVETILKAEILFPEILDMVVNLPGGRIDEIVISNLEPVSSLYQIVADKIPITWTKIKLKVEGRQIGFSSTPLCKAGLARGIIISAEITENETSGENKAQQSELDKETVESVLSSFNARGKHVEVAFSFDTTGSMYSYLTTIREKLRMCCTRLLQDIPNIRISIIAHGDYCDSESLYAIRHVDLTSEVQTLVHFAMDVPATSGGDSPECYELVLKKAQQLDWSEDAAKALVVIGDQHPHPPSYTDQSICWQDELDILCGMGVKVYGVQAGADSMSANFYKELAEVSQGCYLELKHIDVITDMFLAVCYNETDNNMLEDYEQELVTAGNMTVLKQDMISQLKQNHTKMDSTSEQSSGLNKKRYLAQPWWDITLDHRNMLYVYKTETDKWIPAPKSRAVSTVPSPLPSYTSSVRPLYGKREKKRKCSIM